MPRYLFKVTDPRDGVSYYGEWSTVVDAPVTELTSDLDELTSYTRWKYGEDGVRELPERLARVEKTGVSSCHGVTTESLLSGNRAGKGETELTLTQLIDEYKVKPGDPVEVP